MPVTPLIDKMKREKWVKKNEKLVFLVRKSGNCLENVPSMEKLGSFNNSVLGFDFCCKSNFLRCLLMDWGERPRQVQVFWAFNLFSYAMPDTRSDKKKIKPENFD